MRFAGNREMQSYGPSLGFEDECTYRNDHEPIRFRDFRQFVLILILTRMIVRCCPLRYPRFSSFEHRICDCLHGEQQERLDD